MSTSLSYHSTLAILQAVKAVIDGLQLADASGPLFQLVKLYDSTDIDTAFADTLASRQQRLCFILPGRVHFERAADLSTVVVRKHVTFSCLICDTDRKTGQAAVFGGSNNQGTLSLADQLIEGLSGQSFGLRYVCIEPEDGDEMSVSKEGDSDTGRKGWFQSFTTYAGKKGFKVLQ